MVTGEYNSDQIATFQMVRNYLEELPETRISWLREKTRPYLAFRQDVADFQARHFSGVCTRKCFTDLISACCGREGIATFFADTVINILFSSHAEIDIIIQALILDRGGYKCVYLSDSGCLWRIKPIVCEMFLCDHAKQTVLERDQDLRSAWEELRRREKEFTWPSQPILFDELETIFMEAGLDSPLMYFHKSPGLLRVKAGFHNNFKKYP